MKDIVNDVENRVKVGDEQKLSQDLSDLKIDPKELKCLPVTTLSPESFLAEYEKDPGGKKHPAKPGNIEPLPPKPEPADPFPPNRRMGS